MCKNENQLINSCYQLKRKYVRIIKHMEEKYRYINYLIKYNVEKG